MPIKHFLALVLIWSTTAFAQSGYEDGGEFGAEPETELASVLPAPSSPASLPRLMGKDRAIRLWASRWSGNSLTGIGHGLAAGGLIGGIIGGMAGIPHLIIVGNLAHTIGLPLLGVGAGKVNQGAEILNPAYQANLPGMGLVFGPVWE